MLLSEFSSLKLNFSLNLKYLICRYGNPHLGGAKGILTSHRRHQVISKLKRKHEGEDVSPEEEEPATSHNEMDTKAQAESEAVDTDLPSGKSSLCSG